MTGLEIPLHTIIKLVPHSYQYREERKILLNPITIEKQLSINQ